MLTGIQGRETRSGILGAAEFSQGFSKAEETWREATSSTSYAWPGLEADFSKHTGKVLGWNQVGKDPKDPSLRVQRKAGKLRRNQWD